MTPTGSLFPISLALSLLPVTLLAADPPHEERHHPEHHRRHEAQARAAVDRFVATWNRHDAQALTGLFRHEGDLVDVFGRTAVGWAEIEKRHQDDHQGPFKEATLSGPVTRVRLLESDVAVVDARWEICGMKDASGVPAPPLRFHQTMVLERRDDSWRVVSMRAAQFAPLPVPRPR
ncbi:MAG: SgcJ/EcaC family oxidoreductase [Candidatus Riflebacteria bacterium]|nr:SgcJ/EcaC family oxidoreductase [Candidatus Riflebacteria bacterium]